MSIVAGNIARAADVTAAIAAASATVSALATGGTTARTIADRAGDLRTPYDFGAAGNGSTDDTVALNAWLAAGGGGLPVPASFYKVTGTLNITVPGTRITGQGPLSLIKLVKTAGSPAVPVLDVHPAAVGTILDDFAVDHNAAALILNTVYFANIIAGSAILIQASRTEFSRLTVSNGWDNGVSIVQLGLADGLAVRGEPKQVQGFNCETLNNGVGSLTGDGIDLGSGSDCIIANCSDIGSAVGFGLDLGAGAYGSFVNCRSWSPTDHGAGSGMGFYIGEGNSNFVGCSSTFAPRYGFWLDDGAQDVQMVNCQATDSGFNGFWIKAIGPLTMTGCVAKNASVGHSGTYDAFLCDSSGGTAQVGIQLIGCATLGTTHRYGYNETGANAISTQIIGGSWNGLTAGIATGKATGVITLGNPAKVTIGGGIVQSLNNEFDIQTTYGTKVFVAKDSGATTNTFLIAQGGAAGAPAALQAYSDAAANVSLLLQGKGTGSVIVGDATHPVGFFNATGVAKPTVAGAKGGNAALTSLLTALAALGLVSDTST